VMAPWGLLPVDYVRRHSTPLSEALSCLQFQADPIVRCLLSRPSTIADLNRCSARALANSVARCAGQRNYCLSSLSCLFAEWMQGVSLKFLWQRQQFARIFGSSRPVYEIPVLLEFCNFPEPLRPLFVGDSHHIRKVTRSQAAADRQLDPLQQPSGTPLLFQPVHRNRRSSVFCVSTAASLANREMSDNEPLRGQRISRVSRHTFSPSPG
jgi:hypothetical protein